VAKGVGEGGFDVADFDAAVEEAIGSAGGEEG
jgi:hypothetical protein